MAVAQREMVTEPASAVAAASYRAQLAGTSIDPVTLLSADYFNLFNEIVMLLGIFPDLAEDIATWRFKTYEEHFNESGLPFAHLAVEAFRNAAPAVRREFELTVEMMRMMVEETREKLAADLAAGETDRATAHAASFALELQSMIELGGMIVNGRAQSMSQSAIDDLF